VPVGAPLELPPLELELLPLEPELELEPLLQGVYVPLCPLQGSVEEQLPPADRLQ